MVLHQLAVLLLQLAVPLLIGLGFPCVGKDPDEDATKLGAFTGPPGSQSFQKTLISLHRCIHLFSLKNPT